MNKLKLYTLLSFMFAIVLVSCDDELKNDPYEGLPDLDGFSAPQVNLVATNSAVLDITNLSGSAYSIDLDDRGDVASLEVEVSYIQGNLVSDTFLIQTVSSFPSTLNITADQLVAAVDTLERRDADGNSTVDFSVRSSYKLFSSLDSIAAGDRIEIICTVVGTDGTRWSNVIGNVNGDLNGFVGQNTVYDLTTFVSCPFDANAAAGTYNVGSILFNAFGLTSPATLEVTAGPGANQITVVGGLYTDGTNGFDWKSDDMIISVDPNTGIASWGGSNELHVDFQGNFGLGALTYGTITGFVFSCTGTIDIVVTSPGLIDNPVTLSK